VRANSRVRRVPIPGYKLEKGRMSPHPLDEKDDRVVDTSESKPWKDWGKRKLKKGPFATWNGRL
jgi:hypothetical protein